MRVIPWLLSFLLCGSISAAVIPVSFADQRILFAQKRVEASPKSSQAFNELAFALLRKARDFESLSLYDKAGEAAAQALQLSPDDYQARKLQIDVLLGQHRFSEALDAAAKLNRKVPDDIAIWGSLVDVHLALGNNQEAERAGQWILDLRPSSAIGFEKAAAIREATGDLDGANEYLDEVSRRTSENDPDERAWLLTQRARLVLASGNSKQSGELIKQALKLSPDSQLALHGLASVQQAGGDYQAAASILEQRYRVVSSSRNLYDWSEALAAAGYNEQAAAQFKKFEVQAASETGRPYNANLQLIRYYCDRKNDPMPALLLAEQEIAKRHDALTLDAYAWALFRNGKLKEAREAIDNSLAAGYRSQENVCDALRIYKSANVSNTAEDFAKQCRANLFLSVAKNP